MLACYECYRGLYNLGQDAIVGEDGGTGQLQVLRQRARDLGDSYPILDVSGRNLPVGVLGKGGEIIRVLIIACTAFTSSDVSE